MDTTHRPIRFKFMRLLMPVLALALCAGAALAQADPPGRVADLSHRQGNVVFAPAGDNEWTDLPPNRPLVQGDRLWTDRGARAELHMGMAVVHVDDQSSLAFQALDDDEVRLSLSQGTLNARIRQLQPQEHFEVATPNLALRAEQPGDYRLDVDPERFTTHVRVRSGQAVVFDASGSALRLDAGTEITFAGRDLQQVAGPRGADDFDRWALARNQREDQSLAARYIPREVVGYSRLDGYGAWSTDPAYGTVWYPRLTLSDWAPYRYGRWAWISPWGWTWVDDAPWGFAPFHYGRWALIGARWAWVPGAIGPRPRYAPALVVFVGGDRSPRWTRGGGPGIAWYPLAPGDYWRPTYRASNDYVAWFNRNARRDDPQGHVHRRRGEGITALSVADFHRGRPVREHWQRVQPAEIAQAPVVTSITAMPRPERDRERERRQVRLQQPPPPVAQVQPAPQRDRPLAEGERRIRLGEPQRPAEREGQARGDRRDDSRDDRREAREPQRDQRERAEQVQRLQQQQQQAQQERQGREQAQRQQQPVQEQQARELRKQQEQAGQQERAERERERDRRAQVQRQQQQQAQQQQAREQERQAREQRQHQEQAARQQERAGREQAQRHQVERQAREQERAVREQQRQAHEQQREAAQRQLAQQQAQQQQAQQQRAEQQRQRAEQHQPQRAERQQERQQRGAERAMGAGREQRDRGRDDEERGRGQRGG